MSLYLLVPRRRSPHFAGSRGQPRGHPSEASLSVAGDASQPKEHSNTAQRRTAEAQNNHANIPERTTVVPKWEVEAMETVIQPPFYAIVALDLSDDLVHFRVD